MHTPAAASKSSAGDHAIQSPSPSALHQRRREKILVTVRVRPLSSREIAQQDLSAWDCVDSKTIISKQQLYPDRSPQLKSYTFDRVFGPDSATEHVYEEGAKDVALSALTGLNATIFAYGQTSSGKTFTMNGITENAVHDIYCYIDQHSERDFVLKVSALEIYNEVVRDLLNAESGPLRLMDDPEKGTIVERLVEETVKDSNHLKKILKLIEAQRQVGETMLNDTSSRSHQIIRLTVESFPRNAMDGRLVNSLVATLNFVDLAGSERASQTLSEGTRLKEGCHINRSLLTLTTIIRKLSGQGRTKSGHLPYRDSKLTRILQNSLGGNARTAIICTMSPARSHVEQSRNTLFFATQAKEVTNTAHINVVVSDKALVKQLQREVARLEAELKVPEIILPCVPNAEALLHEKDAEIQQLRSAMQELHVQRDLAQARLDELIRKIAHDEAVKHMDQASSPYSLELSPYTPERTAKSMTLSKDGDCLSNARHKSPSASRQSMRQSTTASLMLVQEIRKLEHLQDELGEDANRALEALQKEVECLRLAQAGMNQEAAATIAKLQAEIKNLHALKASKTGAEGSVPVSSFVAGSLSTSLRKEIGRLQAIGDADKSVADTTIATLEEQLESVQKSIDNLVINSKGPSEESSPVKARTPTSGRKKSTTPLSTGHSNTKRTLALDSPRSPRAKQSLLFDNNENNPPSTRDHRSSLAPGSQNQAMYKKKVDLETTDVASKTSTPMHQRNNSLDIKKMQSMFKTAAEENIRSIRAYVTELKERVAKLQYQKQLLVCQVLELEANGSDVEEDEVTSSCIPRSQESWLSLFHKQRMQIIELWDICQVSIIHRSQFYLLFKGDPADEVYMEVELRRLTWLQEHFAETSLLNPEGGVEEEESATSLAASCRALKREREQLAKRMRTRLTAEEREEVYQQWGVALESKQRKLQVAYKVWTDTRDLLHIQESAILIARVVGFWEPGRTASKEMFELAFAPPTTRRPWQLDWNSIRSNLAL